MPAARKNPWLICYDIREPRRLGRVHRYLVSRAIPVQYSVFAGQYSAPELDRLLDGLERIIDVREDDVRAYPLSRAGEAWTYGQQSLPATLIGENNGLDWLFADGPS